MTALGSALLWLTGLLPAGRLGIMIVASFPICISLMMYGPGWAAGVFALTAVLAFLIVPGPTSIGYAAFFGYYPIAKSLCERLRRLWLCRLLKALIYAAAFAVCWLLGRALFNEGISPLPWYAILLIGGAVFVVYDWCFSLLIRFYIEKIARYFS